MKMALTTDNLSGEHNHRVASRSLVVKDDEIIGVGWEQSNSLTDPTSHSAMTAVKNACALLGTIYLDGCVLYLSTQPCPMCLSLFYLTRVDKIIYMAVDTTGQGGVLSLDQEVYKVLIKDSSVRTIPEIALLPSDINKSSQSN